MLVSTDRYSKAMPGLMRAMRELYREHTPEEMAAAAAVCHGPLSERQRELDLKGRE